MNKRIERKKLVSSQPSGKLINTHVLHDKGICLEWHIKYSMLGLVPGLPLSKRVLPSLHALAPAWLLWILLTMLSKHFKILSLSAVAEYLFLWLFCLVRVH